MSVPEPGRSSDFIPVGPTPIGTFRYIRPPRTRYTVQVGILGVTQNPVPFGQPIAVTATFLTKKGRPPQHEVERIRGLVDYLGGSRALYWHPGLRQWRPVEA